MFRDLKSLKVVWKKFMYVLTPGQKKLGVLVFFLSLLGSLAELLGVTVILPLVQTFVEPEKLREYRIIDSICKLFRIETKNGLIILVVIITIIIYILKNLFLFFLSWVRTKYSMKVDRELSLRMMNSYVNRGYHFFRTNNIAVVKRGVTGAVTGVNGMIYAFFKLLSEALTIGCIFVFVFVTDLEMALIMSALAVICMLFVVKLFREKMRKAGREVYEESAINGQWFNQLYYGIKEILVMNRKNYFIDNYENSYIRMQRSQIKHTIGSEAPAFLIEGICVCGILAGVGFRVTHMENPATYIPQLASFAVAAFRIMPSMGRISTNFNGIVFTIPALNDTYDNIHEANMLDEEFRKRQKEKGIMEEDAEENHVFTDRLEIKNVIYHYPDGNDNVLDNVSITVSKGESVALVGPSGAGKSTMADVILGLFEPQGGSVEVDGLDIVLHRKMWSRMIGFVPQAPYLIDDTVRRNIAFGVEDDIIDDERVWKVLEQAQMKEFIEDQTDRLDTIVGERGIRFSGGQAQRLVIARALYNNPDILIFDEATSALDNETEKAVMESIEALQGHKTMIIIAHRLSTIKNCDVIYEIKDGKATVKKYEELI